MDSDKIELCVGAGIVPPTRPENAESQSEATDGTVGGGSEELENMYDIGTDDGSGSVLIFLDPISRVRGIPKFTIQTPLFSFLF